ncbi:MAG: hypothetical protein VKO39_03410 [Cyanobacteriota bacterium]|nr:hypothetical protein [Cyanobacteriota bacterium]
MPRLNFFTLAAQTVHGLPDYSNLLALCADLAAALSQYDAANPYHDCAELLARADAAIAEARAALEATEEGAVVAWCSSEEFKSAMEKGHSFNGWRDPGEGPNKCDMRLYSVPVAKKQP